MFLPLDINQNFDPANFVIVGLVSEPEINYLHSSTNYSRP